MSEGFIASKIIAMREARGMNRQALAERCGMSYSALRYVESGHGERGVTVGTLQSIATALGVNMGAFLEINDDLPAVVEVMIESSVQQVCDRCQGIFGQVETQTRADIAAISGLLTVQRGLAEQAILMAARLDMCTDESKMATLNRELRITMEAIRESVAPKEKEGANGGGAKAADIFGDLGMPVIAR
jgi:transcriptional regulator with XRE-family HTH domain